MKKQFDLTLYYHGEELTITWPKIRMTDSICNEAFDHLVTCPHCLIHSNMAWRDELLYKNRLSGEEALATGMGILNDTAWALVEAIERMAAKPGGLTEADKGALYMIVSGYGAQLSSAANRAQVVEPGEIKGSGQRPELN